MKRLLVIGVLGVFVAACGSTPPSSSPSTRPVASGPAGPVASGAAQPEASVGPAFVGEFAPIELKGKGSKEQVPFTIPDDSIAIATLSHPGKGQFIVTAYDEDGTVTKQLVKTSGKYGGTILFDLEDHSTFFGVQAAGPWKITVRPAEAAKAWDGKATKGRGDQVLRLITPAADGTNLQLKATGTRPYLVRAHSPDDDVDLITGTGPARVAKELPEGTDLVEIVGRGAWQLALAAKP